MFVVSPLLFVVSTIAIIVQSFGIIVQNLALYWPASKVIIPIMSFHSMSIVIFIGYEKSQVLYGGCDITHFLAL